MKSLATSVLQALFVLAFFAVLLLPEAQLRFGLFSVAPIKENRPKLTRPVGELPSSLLASADYARKYEAYYNDHYGLRDLMVRTHNQLAYTVFNESSQVIAGKRPWLFDKRAMENVIAQSAATTPEQWRFLDDKLTAMTRALAAQGARLIVVAVPWKTSFYRDYLPATVTYPKQTLHDTLVARLKQRSDLAVIDAMDVLKAADTPELPSYFVTDFHWNYVGATRVASAVVNEVARLSGISFTRGPEAMEFHPVFIQLTGSEAESLAVHWPPKESYASAGVRRETCGPFKMGADLRGTRGSLKDVVFGHSYYSGCPEGSRFLPPIFVVGSSFTKYFEGSHLYDYFEYTEFMNDHSFFIGQGHDVPAGTKFVIWQIYENQLNPHYILSDAWWQRFQN